MPGLLLKIALSLIVAVALLLGGILLFMPGIHISSIQMALNVMMGSAADTPETELLQRLQVPAGYTLAVYARGIANPRMLHHTQGGHLLVSSPRSGELVQLSDLDGDGAADDYQVLLQGLKRPHGVDVHAGFLYVAESDQVGRIAYDARTGTTQGSYQVTIDGLTDDGNHWSKSIRFDDAGMLYLAQGSTCNVCEEADPRRATIMRFNADGSGGEIYASGLRNSVGLAFAPWDGALYATDNGRDLVGDDFPPCELNHIEANEFYGWPYLNGDNILDPDFGNGNEHLQADARVPAFGFPAHNAPLGIYFARQMTRTALVALHGSWNRSVPDGYKVVAINWQQDGSISSSDFLWGFEREGDIVGRPVDIVGDGNGGFYVSDDYARVVYHISKGEAAASTAAMLVPGAVQQGGASQSDISLDRNSAAAGELLYASLPCAECHGESVLTPVPLQNLASRYSVISLADFFLTPTAPMPQFELSSEQRLQLAHFLLSRESAPAEK